jgi:hypothetical protein
MQNSTNFTRRNALLASIAAAVPLATNAVAGPAAPKGGAGLIDLDPIRTELVMNLVVTCSNPEPFARTAAARDGDRADIWPIVGGRFAGANIKGKVIPGGADYPVKRVDGTEIVDAFYRLQEDDGTNILIHNIGYAYPPAADGREIYRLVPTFTTAVGKHDWLNRSIFLATLVYGDMVPAEMRIASGPNENDRLIQVHRVY